MLFGASRLTLKPLRRQLRKQLPHRAVGLEIVKCILIKKLGFWLGPDLVILSVNTVQWACVDTTRSVALAE
jgi:hypothetical protein